MSDQDEPLVVDRRLDRRSPAGDSAELPVLPLRDTVLFPNSFMPLAVAREASVRLIDEATTSGRMIGVFTQREASVEEPAQDDLYPIGTATHIHKMFKLPDGSLRLIVQGLARIRLDRIMQTRPYLKAAVTAGRRGAARRGSPRDRRAPAQHQEQLPAGRVAVAAAVRRSAGAGRQHHRSRQARRFHRLEPRDHRHRDQAGGPRDARHPRPDGRAQPPADQGARSARARIEDPVAGAVRGRQEPARVLPPRAAQGDPEGARRRATNRPRKSRSCAAKIEAVGMPEAVKKEALRELDRLSKMPVAAAEYTVSRTYLDWVVALPWAKRTEDSHRPASGPRRCSTPITPVSRRSRTG